nr:MAG TPA: hypothetical protein [Caudoviricetes sp.]
MPCKRLFLLSNTARHVELYESVKFYCIFHWLISLCILPFIIVSKY